MVAQGRRRRCQRQSGDRARRSGINETSLQGLKSRQEIFWDAVLRWLPLPLVAVSRTSCKDVGNVKILCLFLLYGVSGDLRPKTQNISFVSVYMHPHDCQKYRFNVSQSGIASDSPNPVPTLPISPSVLAK